MFGSGIQSLSLKDRVCSHRLPSKNWSRTSEKHGTLLTLDADGRFIDEDDTLELCASGNAAEAGAELVMAAKGSCPDPAFEHTSGAALKHSTTGKKKRDKVILLSPCAIITFKNGFL